MATALIKKYLLLLILLMAVVLRFYHVDQLPSLNPDEAALGYNAYSLLQTGKDEHGHSWPLHFRSFGDYKPGGYVYLDLPFIAVLGLNPLAVRLPNLVLSIITIYLVFKLVNLLTSNQTLSLISALVLALSPWHIHFSRGAWESNTALFFIILAIYWFYSSILKHKQLYLYLFPLPLVASFYTYHSARLVLPALFLFLTIFNLKSFLKFLKPSILSLIIAIIITIPVLISFLNNGGTARFGGVGLTADHGPVARAEELLNQHGNTLLINRIIHNKRVLYAISFAEKYFSHFDYNFLFLKGDEVPRSKSVDMGQLYLFELPLLFFGLTYLLKTKNRHLKQFLFTFLFTAPLASALTFQAPSALRSLPLVIPLTILVSFGIYYLFAILHRAYFVVFILVFYIFSLSFYLDSYFVHTPKRYPFAWNTGFSQMVPYIESAKDNYNNIYVTNTYDQPYILYLFFSKYPPQRIQAQIQLTLPDRFGFSTVNQIDNITFNIPSLNTITKNSLIISDSKELPFNPLSIISFPNGQPGFRIYNN